MYKIFRITYHVIPLSCFCILIGIASSSFAYTEILSNNTYTTIYKPNGTEAWVLGEVNPLNDSQFESNDEMKLNSDGSWKVNAKNIRLNVFTSEGYNESMIDTVDREELYNQGYMQSPKDWKNVEMTGYVKVNSLRDGSEEEGDEEDDVEKASDENIDYEEFDDNFSWYARGGQHNDEKEGCEGTSYKGNLHFSGNSSMVKEEWHTGGYFDAPQKAVTEPLLGRWIGFKFVIYNFQFDDNTTAVKLENWLDEIGDGKNWTKIYEAVDFGQWGNLDDDHCGQKVTNVITWGGPIATFRWDNSEDMDVDIKNMSVVEIIPPKVNTTDLFKDPIAN